MKCRMFLWSFVTALLVMANVALAQLPDPEPYDEPSMDHLKCYSIVHRNQPEPGIKQVRLKNQFGLESCTIKTPATRFCVETEKNAVDDPRGGEAGDFLCYEVALSATGIPQCQNVGIVPSRLAQVEDQFGKWKIRVGRPRTICTPAIKTCHGPDC